MLALRVEIFLDLALVHPRFGLKTAFFGAQTEMRFTRGPVSVQRHSPE